MINDEYELGVAVGRAATLNELADLIGGRVMPEHPTDLEVKRWGPGGREHFADPRPGDYPGRASD